MYVTLDPISHETIPHMTQRGSSTNTCELLFIYTIPVFIVRMRLGMFDPPSSQPYVTQYTADIVNTPANQVCIYVCIYVCMYVCINVCMYICVYVCMCVYVYVCMYICVYVCMYVCMYICMYVCLYVCMYVFMYVCMYIYVEYNV